MTTLESAVEIDQPLYDVTFCVVDLETTGSAPEQCGITEVGAATFRGGECLGTFSSLVDPGRPIPPVVTSLTGITDAMVAGAPPIGAVLPSLVEFVGSSVLVGHNLRFDLAFLDEACDLTDRARFDNPRIDTLRLARRLLVDETDNHRLSTLADHFRTAHRPSHRALADSVATADLLHALLERAGSWGVCTIGALLDHAGINGS